MTNDRIYILGGHQSDFARNWNREGKGVFDLFADTVRTGLNATQLSAGEIQVGHVGNFVSPLFTGQSHLGGFFGHVDPMMAHMPASSHEAACASGSMALFGAMADLESGRYDLACVLGLEMMRNVPGDQGAAYLRGAAWADREWCDTPYIWPCAFDNLLDEYERRYGIDKAHLGAISKINFSNARTNPNAQSRRWELSEDSFRENDKANPVISGRIRRQDCGQITDGAAVVFLASEAKALAYAKRVGKRLEEIPYIKGWGHVNAPMSLQEKLTLSEGQDYIFPHVRQLFEQTLGRAGLANMDSIDGMEVHDCFNITEYMVIDHSGIYGPGEAWRAIEEGVIAPGGKLPINMSGGLIGLGHPVGATGVRMVLDCFRQTAGLAGDNQIEAAKNMMTFNLGGSATTCASLIVGR